MAKDVNRVTIVTAFFDINREKKGDGRSINEYLRWIKKTLQLNCNMFIITERKFIDFMKENRPKNYRTYLKEDTLQNAQYYKYRERINEILKSDEYKKKIAHPNRVECKLPEYNIIQYSKFGWLKEAIIENPFNSEYFFWMDIGISRFFNNMNLKSKYPTLNNKLILESQEKFIIQQRYNLLNYDINKDFIWKSDNLFKGGMFGGYKEIVLELEKKIDKIFREEMLEKNNVNNEQLALAILWKKEPNLFKVIEDIKRHPCIILHLLNH